MADLEGDGEIEVIGMTWGGTAYCLDEQGRIKWRKELRPEYEDTVHIRAPMGSPLICDLDGDKELEIFVMTNGSHGGVGNGILFALDAHGNILD